MRRPTARRSQPGPRMGAAQGVADALARAGTRWTALRKTDPATRFVSCVGNTRLHTR
jgi:hypothetical protein